MTPRERWAAVFDRRPTDRIPCDFWSTPEVIARLLSELGCGDEDALWRKLKIDKVHPVEPIYTGPEDRRENLWLYSIRAQEYGEGMGSYDEFSPGPLATLTDPAELEDFSWPDPDWFDFSNIRADIDRLGEWPVRAGCYEPFLLYCAMRGMEQAFADLVLNPEFAETVLQKIFDFHLAFNTRLFEAAGPEGGILFTYVAEDLGGQDSPLMSPKTVERFLFPRMKAMIDLAHSYGIKAFHHDDGAIRTLLPRLVEIGIDLLNPIQWRCPGMEREGLKRDFGQDVIFHGAVDNQQTLPFGTPEEVRAEVRDNIRILGEGGGYIVAPCHNIQPVSPTENILALYEAVEEFGGQARGRT